MPRLFIFGFGYSALALAGQLRSLGWEVAGTTRRPDKIADLRQLGFTVYPFSRETPFGVGIAALADFPYILHSVPPDDLGDPVYDQHGGDIVDQLPNLKWFGYLSTTGVYGDHNGGRVDETTLCVPTNARTMLRYKIEQQWLELHQRCGVPVHIFRLAAIYGPGRNVLATLRSGKLPRMLQPDHIINRIHVEDIAQILLASIHKPAPGNIYNLADDMPARQSDVIAYAAQKLQMDLPTLPVAVNSITFSDSKIVDNAKVKTTLRIRLQYPGYSDGLEMISMPTVKSSR